MKVGDILEVINENAEVNLWREGELVALYDGKSSIDPKWNKEKVLQISAGLFKIDIDI